MIKPDTARGLVALCTALLTFGPPAGLAQTYQLLYVFPSLVQGGSAPYGALVQGRDGSFYGTTIAGGSNYSGSIFKITPEGLFTNLALFNGTNGASPYGGLVQASDGNFYGTTRYGGPDGVGTIFRLTPYGALSVIAWFNGYNGQYALGDLVEGPDGKLYGVTHEGGTDYIYPGYWTPGYGTVFRVATNGHLETLWSFTWAGSTRDGDTPSGGLILAEDGKFYGVTVSGGPGGGGTVYRVGTNGVLTTVASFPNGTHSVYPIGRLLQASDGAFYGAAGGGSMDSTLFRLSPGGLLSTIATFTYASGADPVGGLVQAPDGALYGTAIQGGTNGNNGTVFRVTPGAQLTAFISFGGPYYAGAHPRAGLVVARDGNLYGTASEAGSTNGGNGTVFRLIMPGPALTSVCVGQNIALSWRTNYVGFTLQSSDALSPSNWIDCTNTPVAAGSYYFVTNSAASAQKFFRLKK